MFECARGEAEATCLPIAGSRAGFNEKQVK